MAKFLAMLEIDGGEARPVPISTTYLSSDRTVLIIDEDAGSMYLFIGRDVGLIARRMAERVTQSIKTYGFKYGNMIVGKNCHNLVIIDEKETGTSFRETYQDLINKIELWETVGKSLVDLEKDKPKIVKKIEHPIEPVQPPKVEEKEERKIEEIKPVEQYVNAKIGSTILRLLDKFPEVFIGKISRNGNTVIRLEGPQGFLGEIIISDNGKVEIKPSKEFEAELEEMIKEVAKKNIDYFT
ncbi:MAG: hypothetical protein J7J30_02610 [Candidatus Odinarchaeota archaeon]|nr:hypothetical protein [Candidatus Odinarchaeota archaeon]